MKKIYLKPETEISNLYIDTIMQDVSQFNKEDEYSSEGELTKEHNVFGGNWEEF